MAISYNKLWKLLIDKNMSASELRSRHCTKYNDKDEKKSRCVTSCFRKDM